MRRILPAIVFMLGGCSANSPEIKTYPSSSEMASPTLASTRPTARTFAEFKSLQYGMRERAIVDLVGNADKVTADGVTASYHLSDGTSVELSSDAYLFMAEHITKDGKRHTFIDEGKRYIAPTSRTLAPFKRLKVGMYHADIDGMVGKADKDQVIPSIPGGHDYLYKLSDGSHVWIRYGARLISVHHQLGNGTTVALAK